MLTRLRLKNWRSVKEETIEFTTPITVFIGANSVGKSNIIDALFFVRDSVTNDEPFEQLKDRDWEEGVQTLGLPEDNHIEIEISCQIDASNQLNYKLTERSSFSPPDIDTTTYWFQEELTDKGGNVLLASSVDQPIQRADLLDENRKSISLGYIGDLALSAFGRISNFQGIQLMYQFITQRWQILDENFSPTFRLNSNTTGDSFLLDRCADNLPIILDYMQKKHKQLYNDLQNDFVWLLPHVRRLDSQRLENETRVSVYESSFAEREAPTVSAGTGRLLAILTAHYALDTRDAELPGLVVIEEPDTALNPGLLQKFVEQLRNYTEREGNPRQFILTTHNPAFLNYFEPEEVRVVERDEQGYTHVKRIPEHIEKTWLDQYGLGEVWITNSFGGLPE